MKSKPQACSRLTGKVLRTMVSSQDKSPDARKDTTALGWSELRDALADEVLFAAHRVHDSHVSFTHLQS